MARSKTKLRAALNRQSKWRVSGPPANVQASYYRSIMRYTQKVAAEFSKTVIPALRKIAPIVNDSDTTILEKAFVDFADRVNRLSTRVIERDVKRTVYGVESFQRDVFVRNVKESIGVDVQNLISKSPVRKEIEKAIEENMELIKSVGESYTKRANSIIKQGLTGGKDHFSIENDLMELGGFKDNYKGTEQRRAKTIARDQTQKLMNAIDRERQKGMGVKHYYWQASGDERTRTSHKEYNGKRFAWDDPPSGGHPGEEVNCRCSARPDTEELLNMLEAG